MGFSRKDYWTRLPFPSPGGLLDPFSIEKIPGIEPMSSALAGGFFTAELPRKPNLTYNHTWIHIKKINALNQQTNLSFKIQLTNQTLGSGPLQISFILSFSKPIKWSLTELITYWISLTFQQKVDTIEFMSLILWNQWLGSIWFLGSQNLNELLMWSLYQF